MAFEISVLFLADSHLGFDLPARPRVSRRRRGHDFLANYATALAPALAGEVDLVVHGGDVFDRPGVPACLAFQAYQPLVRLAERGLPVFVVPGNHERSRLPHARLASHTNLHVFDRPRSFTVQAGGIDLALTGLPFERRAVRERFPALLESAGWRREPAAMRLLCMHQCAEGATVGPANFTFRGAPDVIRLGDVPASFAAVLSGHIHRHQVLTGDLRGQALATPVLYPGSIERTSLAELGEPKGFMVLRLALGGTAPRVSWEFRRLPARPMIVENVRVDRGTAALESAVRGIVAAAPPDAVLRIRLAGDVTEAQLRVVSAARLRTLAPATMNVEVTSAAGSFRPRAPRAAPRHPASDHALQLGL